MGDSNIWLYLAAGGVFLGALTVYFSVMILFPEWVGITGKVALEAERSHREGAHATDDDFTMKLQQEKQ